jgi:hypothetical protein
LGQFHNAFRTISQEFCEKGRKLGNNLIGRKKPRLKKFENIISEITFWMGKKVRLDFLKVKKKFFLGIIKAEQKRHSFKAFFCKKYKFSRLSRKPLLPKKSNNGQNFLVKKLSWLT